MSAEEDPTPRRFSSAGLAIRIALFLGTCAAYIPASRLNFIGIDDPFYVFANRHVRGGFTWSGLNWAFTSFDPDNWFPLTRLSHMLDYALFGLDARRHHDVNILFHALAVLFLYAFLRRATGQRWPSAFVAAVFALHPLHVESVAWISERKDVLCALFWFAALWAWVRYVERPSKSRYLLSLMLFAAGLMSKPMIVTLPLLLPVLDIWPLRRPFSRKTVILQLPFLALSAAASVLTLSAQKAAGFVRSLESFPLAARVENALETVFVYIARTFWPAGLSAEYGWRAYQSPWLAPGLATLAALAICGISVLFLDMRRERGYLAAGWFWFLITLLPVIGLIQVGPQASADRYMYVPMTGLLIIVSWGCRDVLQRIGGAQRRPAEVAVAALAGAICITLAVMTWKQEQYWESSTTLFRHAVALDDQNYLAWEYLGTSMDRDTELDARIECYRIAARNRPDFPELHADLGKALLQAGRVPESIAEFETALRIDPRVTKSRCLLGTALVRAGRFDEAISQFERSVRGDPESAMAHDDLAVAWWRASRPDAGRPRYADPAAVKKELARAIALRPDDPLAQTNLGLILLEEPGGAAEAREHFIRALIDQPEDLAAHLGLAKAFAMPPFADSAAAAGHLAAASRLQPDPERRRLYETPRFDTGQPR